MALKVCSEPGCPVLVTKGRCEAHSRAYEVRRGSRQARGYDQKHVILRATWARRVATGEIFCARCKQRISPLEPWHLDHTDDRSGYLGPSHAACNTSHRVISPDA